MAQWTNTPSCKLFKQNVTVTDPRKSAEILERIFDWHVRWEGPSKMGGHTVHVGTDDSYLALSTPGDPGPAHSRPTSPD